MTNWLIILGYALAYLLVIPLAARIALARLMLRQVCVYCARSVAMDEPWCYLGNDFTRHGEKGWKPLGAVRARNGKDAAAALSLAAVWPVLAAVLALAGAVWLLWRGVSSLALRAPLTGPERERAAAEQAKRIEENNREIERLTREIEEAS